MQNLATERKMSNGPEISWPKEFPELKLIDDALKCGICYEYMKTCMVTPCAHSYCSICIRRSLLYKQACPTCFEQTFETGLRNNRALDRLIELFTSIKDKLVKYLRIAAIHFNSIEPPSPAPSQNLKSDKSSILSVTPKRTVQKSVKASTSKGKLNFLLISGNSSGSTKSDISKRLEDILGSPSTNDPLKDDLDCSAAGNDNDCSRIPTVPPMFLQPKIENQPKVDEISVNCPVCGVNIPERNINAHLDNCLANIGKSPVKSPTIMKQKRNPLPKMVWSLMAEKDLRKKLKDYGLNTQGDKKQLISRIQRYILLYNSECDKDNPRAVSELIRMVEREEKQVVPVQSQQRLVINKKSDPKVIEEENNKYLQDNKDSFMKLINAMKEREGHNIKPLKPSSNKIVSDDEDDFICEKQYQQGLKPEMKFANLQSTSKVVESINLCDSNDDDRVSPLSPVLGSWGTNEKKLCNGFISESSEDIPISQNKKIINKVICNNSVKDKMLDIGVYRNSPNLFEERQASPSRSPSPSCINSDHNSDSEDSISLLINRNIVEDDFLEDQIGAATENIPDHNSQLDDPDFVVDTEQIENEISEEMFEPRRKSKRKQSSVPVDSNRSPIPRRTRRRLNK